MVTNKQHANVKMVLQLFKGKHKTRILWFLSPHPLRFNELKKKLEPISKKVLVNQLRELEEDGLVERQIYPEVPVRVEYSISELGKSIKPLFDELDVWQESYRLNHSHRITDENLLIDDYSGDLLLEIVGDKWTPYLLHALHHKKKRFGELKKELQPISQKVLTEHLRNLEKYGLLERIVYHENPPHVEYTLTEIGISLEPLFQKLNAWGDYYLEAQKKNPPH